MKLDKRLAVLVILTMLLAQGAPSAMAAGKAQGKGPQKNLPTMQSAQSEVEDGEESEPPACPPVEEEEGEEEETAALECAETEPSPDQPAPGVGKGNANVNLTGKGKAAAYNPNADAEGQLLPGTASGKFTQAEAEAHIAGVKQESRALAQAERKNGEKGAYLVYVNGEKLNVTPVARDGRTLVPFRKLAEFLGADVGWEPSSRTVTMTSGEITLTLQIGADHAILNGERVELTTPAEIVEGSTFIPLRFIAEALGAHVEWDAETGAIIIITLPGVVVPPSDDDADEAEEEEAEEEEEEDEEEDEDDDETEDEDDDQDDEENN